MFLLRLYTGSTIRLNPLKIRLPSTLRPHHFLIHDHPVGIVKLVPLRIKFQFSQILGIEDAILLFFCF
jgi:hypothetical protein